MGTVEVINYHEEGNEDRGISIMRGSILGNPFKMSDYKEKSDAREYVVLMFYHYLRKEYEKKEKIYDEINSLAKKLINGENIVLRCCCKPYLCHGDIIKNAIEKVALSEIKKRSSQKSKDNSFIKEQQS